MSDGSGFYSPPYSKTFARADLKPETFDLAIKQRGFRVLWEQSILCPCNNKLESGQPDYNCPVCKGKGYIFFGAKETKVITTSINGRKDFERIGMNEQGTAYITPLSTDMVGFRDRFTFLDFTVKFSDIMIKGDSADLLRYNAFDILLLRTLTKEYIRGIDFNISEDGYHIEWINTEIPTNTRYSILYTTNPVYIAVSPIHELRGTYSMYKGQGREYFMDLPSQYLVKREDMIPDGGLL